MPQVQWSVNSYQARALPLSAQRIVNFYAEQAPKDAKSPVVLYGTPGIKTFCDNVGDGPIRGAEVMDGLLYVISGCRLYSVSKDCVVIALGSITGGTGEPGSSGVATARFTITAGTASVGNNQITSVTVDGVEILQNNFNWITSNDATALGLSESISEFFNFQRSVAAQVNPREIRFRSDGIRAFTATRFNENVYQYSLTTPWDVNTLTYDSVVLNIAEGANIDGLDFKDDGTKMYVLTFSNDQVNQYTLSTAWELSTATSDSAFFDVGTENTAPKDFRFKTDGTKMYVLGITAPNTVYQYSLSTAWDITTVSYDSVSFDLSSQTIDESIVFSDDGTKMYGLSTFPNNIVHRYSLSTAWDISTLSYDNFQIDVSNEDGTQLGITLGDSDTRLYVSGADNDKIYEYQKFDKYSVTHIGSDVFIRAPTSEVAFNGLIVEIKTAGDVQVDSSSTTLEGGFLMPAIVETTGGGGIPLTSPDCVSMSHNQASPSQLVIVDGTNGWIFDTTNGLRQITDTDFFSADVVDFQDQYFVFNRAGTGQFFLSNLNDGTAYTATDIATAEGDPDNLISLISNRRELWLFGAETIEIWYNSGDVDFPFVRFEGGFVERGIAAAFSIAEDDNSIIWLGEDRIFYRADSATQQVRISQHGVEEALRKYTIVSDACAFIYTMGGHKFYVCTFPTEDATWVYDITTGLWHERQSVGIGRWRVSVYADAYGKHLVGDFEKGRIGELDLDTFQEYGEVMQGQATGPVVYADRQRIFHRRFELDIDAGPGLTSGQGSDPQVWLDYSDDGGRTWSERKPFRSMGKIGAYLQRLRWLRLGSARQRIYRITVSDPVVRSIVAAHLDAEAGDH